MEKKSLLIKYISLHCILSYTTNWIETHGNLKTAAAVRTQFETLYILNGVDHFRL